MTFIDVFIFFAILEKRGFARPEHVSSGGDKMASQELRWNIENAFAAAGTAPALSSPQQELIYAPKRCL